MIETCVAVGQPLIVTSTSTPERFASSRTLPPPLLTSGMAATRDGSDTVTLHSRAGPNSSARRKYVGCLSNASPAAGSTMPEGPVKLMTVMASTL